MAADYLPMSLRTKFKDKFEDHIIAVVFSLVTLLCLIIWQAIPSQVWNQLGAIIPKRVLAALIGLLSILLTTSICYIFSLKRQLKQSSEIKSTEVKRNLPDLSGRWEGWTYRSLTKEWRPSVEEITQDEFGISANGWGPDNWARGISASIIGNPSAYELVWSYRTEPTTSNYRGGDSHTGTHFLRYSERGGQKFLEGRYVSDRPRDDGTMGAGGIVKLRWVSHQLKTALDFDKEKIWGLPEPDQPPDINVNLRPQPPESHPYSPDEKDKEILRYLYRSDVDRLLSFVAEAAHLDPTETEFRLNRLIANGFVRRPARPRASNPFPEYRLLDKGIELVLQLKNKV
jgi:hypothetical protein